MQGAVELFHGHCALSFFAPAESAARSAAESVSRALRPNACTLVQPGAVFDRWN